MVWTPGPVCSAITLKLPANGGVAGSVPGGRNEPSLITQSPEPPVFCFVHPPKVPVSNPPLLTRPVGRTFQARLVLAGTLVAMSAGTGDPGTGGLSSSKMVIMAAPLTNPAALAVTC